MENKKLLSRYELIPTLIKATSFEVVFIKKNGKERTMKCRFESTRYIEQSILTVYDLVKQQYRSINFKTLSQIIIEDMVYKIISKGKFLLLGNRKDKILENIQEIISDDISVLNSWTYTELLNLYDELKNITVDYDLEAVKALFEYAYETGSIDFDMSMVTDVIEGNLEFIPRVTLKQVLKMGISSLCIPLPDYINDSYINYDYNMEDIIVYYYEASNGVLQVKKV
ncbi:MAG: hypothetical protein L3J10_05100 [Sulfurimonas sp.]|nr:hypothetical protein [Sulfurimonas sp.]